MEYPCKITALPNVPLLLQWIVVLTQHQHLQHKLILIVDDVFTDILFPHSWLIDSNVQDIPCGSTEPRNSIDPDRQVDACWLMSSLSSFSFIKDTIRLPSMLHLNFKWLSAQWRIQVLEKGGSNKNLPREARQKFWPRPLLGMAGVRARSYRYRFSST